MKQPYVIVKNIEWGHPIRKVSRNGVFVVPVEETYYMQDLIDDGATTFETAECIKSYLERTYGLHVTGFTIRRLHKYIKNAEKELVFKWLYAGEEV